MHIVLKAFPSYVTSQHREIWGLFTIIPKGPAAMFRQQALQGGLLNAMVMDMDGHETPKKHPESEGNLLSHMQVNYVATSYKVQIK